MGSNQVDHLLKRYNNKILVNLINIKVCLNISNVGRWDFTCVNTVKDTFLFECAKESGKAAIGGEKRKDRTYEKLLRNYIFVPIAVETFGSWGPRGLKFVKEIGRKIQEKTGNKKATSHIIQAISMTVQRGNATSIMGTLGPLRKLEDFFDIISPREEES